MLKKLILLLLFNTFAIYCFDTTNAELHLVKKEAKENKNQEIIRHEVLPTITSIIVSIVLYKLLKNYDGNIAKVLKVVPFIFNAATAISGAIRIYEAKHSKYQIEHVKNKKFFLGIIQIILNMGLSYAQYNKSI